MAVDDRSDDAGEVPAYHPGGKVPQEDRRFTPGYAQQVAAEQAAKRREFEKKIEAMRNRAADAQGESSPEARRPDAPASGGAASAEPDGQVLRSAPRNAPLPRDSAPSPANPLPRGGDSPRPPSAGRSGASPRAQAGAVQAAPGDNRSRLGVAAGPRRRHRDRGSRNHPVRFRPQRRGRVDELDGGDEPVIAHNDLQPCKLAN